MHRTRWSSCRVPGGWAGAGRQGAGWLGSWLGWSPCLPTRALGLALPARLPCRLPAYRQHGVRTVAEWSCAGWLRRHPWVLCGGVLLSVPAGAGVWQWPGGGHCPSWAVATGGGVRCRRWRRYGIRSCPRIGLRPSFAPRPVAMSQAGRTLTPSSATDQANTGGVRPVPVIAPRLAR